MIDLLDPYVTEALRSLNMLLASGVDITSALQLAAKVGHSSGARGTSAARQVFLEAAKASARGVDFVEIVRCLEPALAEGERAAIITGYQAGRLEACLNGVIELREAWHSSRRQIRTLLILPTLSLVGASFVAPLPWLIAKGGTIGGYLIRAGGPPLLLILGWQAARFGMQARRKANNAGANSLDKALLRAPVIKEMEHARNLYQFSALLALQLRSGVPITTAIRNCAASVPNGLYSKSLYSIASGVHSGKPLSTLLQDNELWPASLVATVAIGEQAGTLDTQLDRAASNAREDYFRAVTALASWLPRIIYAAVSLFILWNIGQGLSGIMGDYSSALGGSEGP